ncbi:hypothetical protein OHA25_42850 [Nonomuraea sp. NBC_00507]|uniref:hypothetical protein n=1 Tax=Nonomuraea sp. NBC_00507 TaxID=2976002 RepID=UPI002E19CBE3
MRSALGLSTASTADLPVRVAALSLLRRPSHRPPRRPAGTEGALEIRDLPRITLPGLADEAASALLDEQGWGSPGPARRAIVSAVGGNPLALEEVVRLGDPSEVAERIVLTGTAPVGRRLRAVYAERTRDLPEQVRTLLLVAAAEDSGRTDIVLGAAGRLGAAAGALDAAERAEHLDLSGPRLRFRHPLVRAAVYADASAQRRASVHRALADELASRAGPAQRRGVHRQRRSSGCPDCRLHDRYVRAGRRGRDRGPRDGAPAGNPTILSESPVKRAPGRGHRRPRSPCRRRRRRSHRARRVSRGRT